ncbi:MAG: MBL fold metallo-hydrolase [Treponema sp.]|jgi:L-ascorbate metabolism protein UlaG (beta-lactamase superfamily)|nr:MBL fold metallo-hydrolase [Treponema sp.]
MKLPFAVIVMVSLCGFVQCASQPVFDEADWFAQTSTADSALLYAPHVNDRGGFFNPWLERTRQNGRRSWFLSRLFGQKPQFDSFSPELYSAVPNDYAYLADPDFDSISFAGHASMIIKMDSQIIFTDPFFSNAALIKRKDVKTKFDFSKLSLNSKTAEKPVVLISHNHYDHLDRYSVKELIKKEAVFIVPSGLKNLLSKWGAREVHELDWWESVSLGAISYTFLPAQHWSRRIGQNGGKTLWGGFLIEGSKTIYFSGDTGYFMGFQEFGRRYDVDYALLGAGAYEPRWFMHYSHMNVEEFFRAADELRAKTAIPMHFGAISLSDEPLLYPLYEVDKYLERNPACVQKIVPLRVGELLKIE